MAYLVTEYSQKPDSFKGAVKKIIRDFIAAIRVAMFKMGVVNLKELSPDVLAAMARQSLNQGNIARNNSREKTGINGNKGGFQNQSAMASVYAPEGIADLPDYKKQFQVIEAKYFNTDGSKKPGAMLAPNGERSKLKLISKNFPPNMA
ncbi:MAG: hypothetical protein ABL933_17185 [Methyloglobulus sp.]|nr:hypothetical protein [Methyloglobulus sp.]